MRFFKLLVILGIAMMVTPLSIQAVEEKVTPESLPGVQVIGVDKVKEWLDAGDEVFILDARKAGDYEAGHLPEAENLTVPSELSVDDAAISKSIEVLEKFEALKE